MSAGSFHSEGRALQSGVLGLLLFSAAACKRAPPPAEKPAPPVATVNGAPIPLARVQAEVDKIRAGSVEGPAVADPADTPQLARAVLDALIDRTLVLQRAKSAGIQVSEAEVQRETDALAESVRNGGDTFGQHLARDGQSADSLAEATRERLLAAKYVADETRREAPSKAEVRAWFDTHKGEFEQPEMARCASITVRSAEEAKSVLDQLRKGAKFEELARTRSITPDSRIGGDLGWFPKGTMPKEFDAFCFGTAAGKLSGVIQTPYGYSVLKAFGRRPGKRRSFEEVKADVERRALAEKRAEAERQLLAQLHAQAEIRIDAAVLANIR